MKILKARINWMDNCINDPRMELLVDKIPEIHELEYKRIGTLYLAENDGYVSFFIWSGKKNDGGYGGAEWTVKVNGKRVLVKGPWSSRSGIMNMHFTEQVMEVSITEDPEAFERGYTFMAGNITIEKAQEAFKLLQGIRLMREVDGDGEITYIPIKASGNIKEISLVNP